MEGKQEKDFSEEDYPKKEVTEKIIGAAFTVHNKLGSGFVEKIYENALVKELQILGLKAEPQKPLKVLYGGDVLGEFSADILVEDCVLVELKATHGLERNHEDKLLHYLKASGIEVGLLINFGRSVQVRRKVCTLRRGSK
ncbi:MAG: GxxExxY protein [Bacteroidota bacterium]